jgi:hypothetical protein
MNESEREEERPKKFGELMNDHLHAPGGVCVCGRANFSITVCTLECEREIERGGKSSKGCFCELVGLKDVHQYVSVCV